MSLDVCFTSLCTGANHRLHLSQTPVREVDVEVHSVDEGMRAGGSRKAGGGGHGQQQRVPVALISFSILPSAESMSIHLVQQRVTSVAFASGVLAVLERGHVDDVVRGASERGKERARSERERRVGGDGGVGGSG